MWKLGIRPDFEKEQTRCFDMCIAISANILNKMVKRTYLKAEATINTLLSCI